MLKFQKLSVSLKKSGLLKIFKDKTVKNIVDYTIGIEVGLDSNGRKNRGGNSYGKSYRKFCERKSVPATVLTILKRLHQKKF